MLIAQITDTHIVPKGELLYERVDSAANLAQVVRQILQLDTPADCVLLTGDLTDGGTAAAYAQLRELIRPLNMPIYAIPGNHDLREPMRAAFSDCAWMPKGAGDRVCYSFDMGPLRICALDTLVEGEAGGALDAAQLTRLDAALTSGKDRPAIVMLHHPPVKSGIPSMDAMRLRSPETLGAVIERHANVERVICGHLHRTMHVRWRGTTVSVAPSTVDQIHLAFREQTQPASIAEPMGYQLHYWDDDDRLITHMVPVGNFASPIPYA
jgi:3',5'-cyclic AMP phosphodiesterase CpdA